MASISIRAWVCYVTSSSRKNVSDIQRIPARIPLDDVYCGILLDKLSIRIVHRPRWFKDRHPQNTEQDYFKIELLAQEMEEAWKRFEGDFEK